MPEFVSKTALLCVPWSFEMQDLSSERFEWLAKKITMEEFEAALSLCNNTTSGEDGIRFGTLKKLRLEGKIFLFHIFNDILLNGDVPGSWQRTKIIPILKPGKNSSNSDSYRPISMLLCT
jgi:hypothetical protein